MRIPFCFSLITLLFWGSIALSQNIPSPRLKSLSFYNASNSSSEKDSLIISLVKQVNADSIKSYMQKLESFNTRYAYASNRYIVTNWLIEKFRSFGYENVEVDSFLTPKKIWCRNICVTLRGKQYPNIFCLSGAHYDSYSYALSDSLAPGAVDNASGTAAVLEMARIARLYGFVPNYTIKFITFGAEEAGLLGSKYLAEKYKALGQNIKLMINQDMIAYTHSNDSLVEIYNTKRSEPYSRYAAIQTERFTNLTNDNTYGSSGGSSDHYSFGDAGYPSISFQEYDIYGNTHSSSDSIIYCNTKYCTEVTKASLATILLTSISPANIRNLHATNVGDGKSIHLSWQAIKDTDLKFYKIKFGNITANFDTSITTLDTSIVISDLCENISYFSSISAVNNSNLEGVATEVSIIPLSIPTAPKNLMDTPGKDNIILAWGKNTEEDLLGYNVYRSIDTALGYIKLNPTALKDTVYIDRDLTDTTYFYKVTAIDKEGNESINNLFIKSHSVTLNHGILVVDETIEPGNNISSDEQVDNYFANLLTGFTKSDLDLKKRTYVKLSELGQYSIVIWHNSNLIYNDINTDAIKRYLDFGGKFLYTGYRVSDFYKRYSYIYVNPCEYKEGDFIYDYLKIKHTEWKNLSYFSGAISVKDYYPSADVDKLKNTIGSLTQIESITPAPGAFTIYNYNSKFDSATDYGSMKGLPVGIEYTGSNFKVVILDFPLFYINSDQARDIMRYIIENKFDYHTSVKNSNTQNIKEYSLGQNYPNPFNPSTNILCEIPKYSFIKLQVFDILGREISTLFEGYLASGKHIFEFNARNLTSGIYFYCLSVNGNKYVKKMSLIR